MVRLYVDCRGVRYRVHDAVYGVRPAAPFKRMRVPLGDPRATVRYFKPETGATLVNTFKKGESRELTEAALVRRVRTGGFSTQSRRTFRAKPTSRLSTALPTSTVPSAIQCRMRLPKRTIERLTAAQRWIHPARRLCS
jgi:hypothetical protein